MTKRIAHKCCICQSMTDGNDIYIESKSRYCHIECFNKLSENEKKIEQLYDKCKECYGEFYNKRKIDSGLSYLLNSGKNIDGIYNCICYWYDIQHNDPARSNGGLGIIPFIYDEAQRYYETHNNIINLNSDVKIDDIISDTKYVKIYRHRITQPKRVKLFEL